LPSHCKNEFADPERAARFSEGTYARISIALLPALVVFALASILPSLMGRPEGLSLTRLIRGMPMRLVMLAVTTVGLVAPVAVIPRILSFAAKRVQGGLLGQLVRTEINKPIELKMPNTHLLRPSQGIALSLIFTDRLLQIVELTGETTYPRLLVRLILPMLGNLMVSLLLSIIWALDDLGLRFYFKKTGEVRTAGSNVGLILPAITGAFSVASLFWNRTITEALVGVIGIGMASYPPYVFFVVIHHEFVKRNTATLLNRLSIAKVETALL